jgi:hypothetical protein
VTCFFSHNNKSSGASKHIDLRYFVRERVQDCTINLEHIDTKKMLTDSLTKGLPSHIFYEHVASIGLMESLWFWTGHIKQPTPITNNDCYPNKVHRYIVGTWAEVDFSIIIFHSLPLVSVLLSADLWKPNDQRGEYWRWSLVSPRRLRKHGRVK